MRNWILLLLCLCFINSSSYGRSKKVHNHGINEAQFHASMKQHNPGYDPTKHARATDDVLCVYDFELSSLIPIQQQQPRVLSMTRCSFKKGISKQLENLPVQNLFLTDCKNIGDYSFLKKMPNLQYFNLDTDELDNALSFLKDIKNLKSLAITSNDLTDISCLKGCKKLKNLALASEKLTDYSPLKKLKIERLEFLSNGREKNSFTDKDTKNLTGLPLKSLFLNETKITNIDFLSKFPKIEFLSIPGDIEDLTPLLKLKKLYDVDIGKKKDLTPTAIKRLIAENEKKAKEDRNKAAKKDPKGSDDEEDEGAVIDPKLIVFSVKNLCKTRKIKSFKEYYEVVRTIDRDQLTKRTGTDYMKDDKYDHTTLTVTVQNRNKGSLRDYKVVTQFYVGSVTDRKPTPEMYKEYSENIDRIKPKGKYTKDFESVTAYDKSEDQKTQQVPHGSGQQRYWTTKVLGTTPAYGKSYYGYKVELVDKDGNVVKSKTWPSRLINHLKSKK